MLFSTYSGVDPPRDELTPCNALNHAASQRRMWRCGWSRSLQGSGRGAARPPAATAPPAPSSRCVIIVLNFPWRCQKSQSQLVRDRCSPPAATAASSVLRSAQTPDPE